MKEDKLLWTCVYKDTIPGWPFDEDGYPLGSDTNLCDIPFPESILRKWFWNTIGQYHPDYPFEHWFYDDCTADDTDGLFAFAVDQGYYPESIVL